MREDHRVGKKRAGVCRAIGNFAPALRRVRRRRRKTDNFYTWLENQSGLARSSQSKGHRGVMPGTAKADAPAAYVGAEAHEAACARESQQNNKRKTKSC
jgi:hypothetical protein